MADIKLPMELVNKLINLGGVEKKLKCLKCRRYTDHVSISYSKVGASKIAGRLIDLFPLAPTLIGSLYVCMKCDRKSFDDGLLSDIMNKKKS